MEAKVLHCRIFRFDNVICPGTARVGICYTADECAIRGGRSTNTCAQGFGVCCICKWFIVI